MSKFKSKQKHNPKTTKSDLPPLQLVEIFNRGNTFLGKGEFNEAIACYQEALLINPNFAEADNNMGVALQQLGRFSDAIKCHQRALLIKPDYAQALQNLGLAFTNLGDTTHSFKNLKQALLLEPHNADLHLNLGLLLIGQEKNDEAISAFQQALILNPNLIEAHLLLGNILRTKGKLKKAMKSYQKALLINPDYVSALDELLLTRMQCCDWTDYLVNIEKAIHIVNKGQQYRPFNFFSISASAFVQQQCAKNYARNYPISTTPLWNGEYYPHDKIRVAYISGDFRDHAVSYLMAGVFEQHNKEQFEIIAISLNPENKSVMGQRIKNAFDQFIDVSNLGNYEVAELIKKLEIDIAIDLMGITQNCRPEIFAYHPAPIQINYLGFPGTMGANYMDYILADNYLIPSEYQTYYTEKVVYLPDCFQANDDKRITSTSKPTRFEVGLPKSGFVFCSFNNSYKITPIFFDIWMRLLKATPNSVLWLISDNSLIKNNLCFEANKRDIHSKRLIFAEKLSYENHLARLQLADLFLDTLPFNAGTTASDALWAGVPLITCSGEAFAARMAGSLLHAIGLPELITQNLADYEALALKLATHPQELAKIKAKLAKNRDTYPLFNTKRFTRHLESAYITMWERNQQGKLPVSFNVSPINQ